MLSRADSTKQRIFASMVKLMGAHGYQGVSVDEIAADAGVAKGTIYYHYKGKAEMMEALMIDRLTPAVAAFEEAGGGASVDPLSALMRIIEVELGFLIQQRSFARLLITELWREDRGWRGSLMKLRAQLIAPIERVLDAGVDRAVFRPLDDAHFVASAIFGVTATSALDYLAFEEKLSEKQVVQNVQAMVFESLKV